MFRGVNGVNIDSKGRIVMPTRYRDRLLFDSHACVVLTIDTEERCLLLYPLTLLEEIQSKAGECVTLSSTATR